MKIGIRIHAIKDVEKEQIEYLKSLPTEKRKKVISDHLRHCESVVESWIENEFDKEDIEVFEVYLTEGEQL